MRIVFISSMDAAPWGGSEELWSRVAARLRSQGHQVGALIKWWPHVSERVTALMERGVDIQFQARPYMRFPVRLWRRLASKAGVKQRDSDLRWLIGQKPDIVCVSSGGNMDGLHFLEMCLQNDLPYVSLIQANSESAWPVDEVAGRSMVAFGGAKRAFFVSTHNQRLFEMQLGAKLGNTEVVRNPFNVNWNASPEWPDADNGLKFACVGRMDPRAKGQDLLFQVLALDAWRVRAITVTLFGSGPMDKGLRRLAADLEIGSRCHFGGVSENIEQIWAAHHALVLPSRFEGLPLVLVEAMLCGRPAIITAVGGNAELVEDGVSGFVAESATLGALSRAMETAWERRNELREMGRAARSRVETLIPKDPVACFCERLLEQVV